MPSREMRRLTDWRGQPTREAREMTAECARAWGVVLQDQREPYYVPALPEQERKGEP